WYQVIPFFLLPFILFAPVNGAIANSLPKRWVLIAACAFSALLTVALGTYLPPTPAYAWGWCAAVGLNMLGTAFYSPTRYALVPAIAQDARVPLPRVNGWIEMGSAVGIVIGLLLGVEFPPITATGSVVPGFPQALLVIALLNGLALVTALPVQFPSDVVRREP